MEVGAQFNNTQMAIYIYKSMYANCKPHLLLANVHLMSSNVNYYSVNKGFPNHFFTVWIFLNYLEMFVFLIKEYKFCEKIWF